MAKPATDLKTFSFCATGQQTTVFTLYLKELSYAHQSYIYLIYKTVILKCSLLLQ